MKGPIAIDATHFPEWVLDVRAPVWWGTLLLIAILSTFSAMMIGSYFYLAQDFSDWPPPQPHTLPALDSPPPDLDYSSLVMVLLLVSCIPAYVVDRAARRLKEWRMRIGLMVVSGLGITILLLRWREFDRLHFRWDENAYGSVTWGILTLHSLFIYAATVVMLLMMFWSWFNSLDKKHAFDTTIACLFWYWAALIWIPSYIILYWGHTFL